MSLLAQITPTFVRYRTSAVVHALLLASCAAFPREVSAQDLTVGAVLSDSAIFAEREVRARLEKEIAEIRQQNQSLESLLESSRRTANVVRTLAPDDMLQPRVTVSDRSVAITTELVGKPGYVRVELRPVGVQGGAVVKSSDVLSMKATLRFDGLGADTEYVAKVTVLDFTQKETPIKRSGESGPGFVPELKFRTKKTTNVQVDTNVRAFSRSAQVSIGVSEPVAVVLTFFRTGADGSLVAFSRQPEGGLVFDEIGAPLQLYLKTADTVRIGGLDPNTNYAYDLSVVTSSGNRLPERRGLFRTNPDPTELDFATPIQASITLGVGLQLSFQTTVSADSSELVLDFGKTRVGETVTYRTHKLPIGTDVSFSVTTNQLKLLGDSVGGQAPIIRLSINGRHPETGQPVRRTVDLKYSVILPKPEMQPGLEQNERKALQAINDVVSNPERTRKMKWNDWISLGIGSILQII